MEEPKDGEIPTEQTPNQQITTPTEPQIQVGAKQPIHKRLSKKWGLILLAVLLLIGGGVATWALTHKKSNTVTTQTNSTTQPSQNKPVTKTSPYFYLAPDTKSISVYNPETKTKSSIVISAGTDEAFTGGSIGSNKSVQISGNGSVVAYSTGKQKDCGEGGCEITDTFIYTKVGDKSPEQVVKVSQPQMLDDWVISPDGKDIFYLINRDSSKAAGFDLHKLTIADEKDVLIKENVFGTASVIEKTPMFALGSDSFRVYANQSDIKEYSYENGNLTSRSLGVNKFCGDCRVEYGQPLSSDGKTLILESGNISGTFSYYTLDLTNGNHKQIVKTAKTTEQLLSAWWSPDGKSIAYDITANGGAGQNEVGFKFRFEDYNIASGKTTVGFTDPSTGVNNQNYSKHFVNLLGWSTDNSYIAFLNEDTVKLYKFADANTVDTGIGAQNPISSDVGFGWFAK